ncbi:extracellular solute-binding protein [Paenibacillus hodogayensis]|uniref:Extracellular solute-binding protein n=1 Tax=Paenibacillus hodogayensis TaxID=279208 RepID=A0ABV5W894_9BACL
MRKGLSLFTTLGLSLAMVAGCSSGTKAPSGSSGTPGTGASGTPAAPVKQTFSMLTESHASWPYNKDWLIWKLLEEKTGVTIDMQVPSGKLDEAVNLAIASGNMPDMMFMLSDQVANKFGQQGALVNILDYINDMPNFKKWMEKYPEISKSAIAADGKMYKFPNEGFGETNRMIWLYREDVFKDKGLTPPKTYDELYTVLKKLKELYPNSYPLAFRNGPSLGMLLNLSANFSTHQGYYYENNELKYGPISDNYKKAIEYLNKFYKEGLIPPDWLTIDTKQWQDIMSTNRGFITFDYISRIDFFNLALRKDNPKFNMAFMAPPAGLPGGKQLNAYTQFVESGLTVSSKSKNIKNVMKYIDFYYSDEGRNIASWGKEGETYTVVNGKKQIIKDKFIDVSDMRKKTGLATNGVYTWIDFDAHLSLASPELQAAYPEARKYDDVFRPRASFNEKEQEVISTTGLAIDKHREENITKFILGERSLNDWDKYIDEAKKLGLQKVMDTYKIAFERAAKTSLK